VRYELFLDVRHDVFRIVLGLADRHLFILDVYGIERKDFFEAVVVPIFIEDNEDAGLKVVVGLHVYLDAAHDDNLSVLDELLDVDDLQDVVADMLEHYVRDFGGIIFSRCNALLVFVAEEFDVVHLAVARQNLGRRWLLQVLYRFVCANAGTAGSR